MVSTTNGTLDLSIIIPFKDKSDLTNACLRSLRQYGEVCKEILLVSNNSVDSEIKQVQQLVDTIPGARLLIYNEPFNFQKINNWAAAQAKGKVLFLLNNDIELIEQSRGLISAMYVESLKTDVGAVGAVLIYEDRRSIQHAGVYLVAGGNADHLYIGKKYAQIIKALVQNPTDMLDIRKNNVLTAVTAAALMVEKRKFDEIGGMKEVFIIGGGDIDLCIRLRQAGYKSVLLGSSNGYMVHKESKSRSALAIPYVDFVESYKSYIQLFDLERGDQFMSQKVINHGK